MKALSVSERLNLERYVSQQVYYSLVARELEFELIPLGLDQGVGILVWSPLAFGFLSGKYRRGQPPPVGTRRAKIDDIGTVSDVEKGYDIVEVLHEVANNRGVSVAQVALNWLLRQSGITSVIIGARNEQQLRDNLGAAQWELTLEEVNRLNQVSAIAPIYPYWHQRKFGSERIPQ